MFVADRQQNALYTYVYSLFLSFLSWLFIVFVADDSPENILYFV